MDDGSPSAPELTASQINRLGERLRKGSPSGSDLETLEAFRLTFDRAQHAVLQTLRNLGLEPSARIKTTTSIVEKLKRESIRLSRLQDIAGCRIVVTDIPQQDHVLSVISDAFPDSTVIDRRKKPSHGYRAVHVVANIGGRFVEIQIRTELQHFWALWSETWAAEYDQSLKYGGGPPFIQQLLNHESATIQMIESHGIADFTDPLTGRNAGANVAAELINRLTTQQWPQGMAKRLIRLVEMEGEISYLLSRAIMNVLTERKEP